MNKIKILALKALSGDRGWKESTDYSLVHELASESLESVRVDPSLEV